MANRAMPSGISLTEEDAALVKGTLARGDRQHDIAAWFGVNGGRIGEIAAGSRFCDVRPAPRKHLSSPGPYISGKDATVLIEALGRAWSALENAEGFMRGGLQR